MPKKVALDKHLKIQRNYLMWVAHIVLGISLSDVASIFHMSRQAVFEELKKSK